MIEVCQIDSELVVIKGIGKSFYQDGFPIALTVSELIKNGYKISVLHIADELLKNEWKPERVINVLATELSDTIQGDYKFTYSMADVRKFCYLEYEDQREMIFNYLFSNENNAKNWFETLILNK